MRRSALLVVPLIVGVLIAVAVLLINGLRERRERNHTALREARRLDNLDYATLSARPASAAKPDASHPSHGDCHEFLSSLALSELVRRLAITRIVVVALNAAIVWYLIRRLALWRRVRT